MKTPDNTQRIEKMLKSDIRQHKICDIVGGICCVLFVAFFAGCFVMIPLIIWVSSWFLLGLMLSCLMSWMFGQWMESLGKKRDEYDQSIKYRQRVLDLRYEPERDIYADFEEKIKERML